MEARNLTAEQEKERENNLQLVVYQEDTDEGEMKKFFHCMDEMQNISSDFIQNLGGTFQDIKKKLLEPLRREYLLNHDNSYLEKTEEIKSGLKDLADELQFISSEDEKRKIKNQFNKIWSDVLLLTDTIVTKVKPSVELKVNLDKDDIDQYFVLTCEDLFGNFKFTAVRKISRERMQIPEESPEEKLIRGLTVFNAQQSEYKKTFQYKALSFFGKHPVVCATAIALGGAVVGYATGCAVEYAAGMMGYKK